MQKHIVMKLLAASTLTLSAAAFAAPSGSPSGSAGLGIDTGLGASISSVVPGTSISNSGKPGMGGPMQGVANLNAKKQESKGK